MNLPRNHLLVYLITSRLAFRRRSETAGEDPFKLQIEAARRATQAGCQLVQVREKDLTPAELRDFTRQIIEAVRPLGAKVLVNDRLDVALASGADGAHLRVDSLPAAAVRSAIDNKKIKNFLIGASTHSIKEAVEAEAGGADFIVSGPVFDTPSKGEFGPPLGLEKFAEICRSVKIPTLALGGITLANFHQPLKAGAAGIAGVSMFINEAGLNFEI